MRETITLGERPSNAIAALVFFDFTRTEIAELAIVANGEASKPVDFPPLTKIDGDLAFRVAIPDTIEATQPLAIEVEFFGESPKINSEEGFDWVVKVGQDVLGDDKEGVLVSTLSFEPVSRILSRKRTDFTAAMHYRRGVQLGMQLRGGTKGLEIERAMDFFARLDELSHPASPNMSGVTRTALRNTMICLQNRLLDRANQGRRHGIYKEAQPSTLTVGVKEDVETAAAVFYRALRYVDPGDLQKYFGLFVAGELAPSIHDVSIVDGEDLDARFRFTALGRPDSAMFFLFAEACLLFRECSAAPGENYWNALVPTMVWATSVFAQLHWTGKSRDITGYSSDSLAPWPPSIATRKHRNALVARTYQAFVQVHQQYAGEWQFDEVEATFNALIGLCLADQVRTARV